MNLVSSQTLSSDRRRWTAFIVVCMAQLMVVLDVTIVNVALPSIQHDLHFSQANLTWVVNAFLVTFGSLLLLFGRIGDLIGRKRVFLVGVVVFTAASLLCGIAPSQGALIAARFAQGIGAAAQASVILAIIITEFPKPSERARAMSAYVFVSVAGGSLGLPPAACSLRRSAALGVLRKHPDRLDDVCARPVPDPGRRRARARARSRLDRLSARHRFADERHLRDHPGHQPRLAIPAVLGIGGLAAVLMAAFLTLEARIENPIMPLRILRLRGLVNASLVRGFLVTGMYSTFFLGTLYLEHVRHYSSLQTGAAFLPWTLTVAVLSQGVTAPRQPVWASRVLTAGMASASSACSCSAPSARTPPSSRRSSWPVSRSALNRYRLHASAHARDGRRSGRRLRTRLRDHQRLPQISGALGLAVLSTLAANHTKDLCSPTRAHRLADRWIRRRLPQRSGGHGSALPWRSPSSAPPRSARPASRRGLGGERIEMVPANPRHREKRRTRHGYRPPP